MTDDELLERYGLHPTGPALEHIRALLLSEASESYRIGDGDNELMKLCCVQLFHHGSLDDVLLIWHAKESNWDAHCYIDVQLLCGAGVDATKAFLAANPDSEARKALAYLVECEEGGNFARFSVARQSAFYHHYYQVPPEAGDDEDG